MKKIILIAALISLTSKHYSQWQNIFTSASYNYNVLSGWIDFDKVGSKWKNRIYALDTIKFQIMQQGYSNTPEFTYTFSDAEKLVGNQIYSLQNDLNNDNKVDFYVLSGYGTSTAYRQAFKIINITNGQTIFEKNDPAWSFSYPTITDLDNDGILECIVVKYNYPAQTNYYYEIYNTGISGLSEISKPISFELKQNFPNPFSAKNETAFGKNQSTTIEYNLKENQYVKIEIYDIKGELVKTLVNEFQNSGQYKVIWNGSNKIGSRLPTGVYFYSLTSNQFNETKKMIILK